LSRRRRPELFAFLRGQAVLALAIVPVGLHDPVGGGRRLKLPRQGRMTHAARQDSRRDAVGGGSESPQWFPGDFPEDIAVSWGAQRGMSLGLLSDRKGY
jgi:hypothetical protein